MKIEMDHPIHTGKLEVYLWKEEDGHVIVAIPEESFSTIAQTGKVDWHYSNLFADSEIRKQVGEVIENSIAEM